MKTDWKKQLEIIQQQNRESQAITDESFTIGKIISMHMEESDGIVIKDGYSSRRKYLVVIGFTVGNTVGFVLINHEINQKVINTEGLINCQYPIRQSDYPNILRINSFIDCSEIFEVRKDKIKQKGLEIGDLTWQDRDLVMGCLKETDVISPKEKKKYGILNYAYEEKNFTSFK
jgi:hypothetical protein